jgi:hypothetical protein
MALGRKLAPRDGSLASDAFPGWHVHLVLIRRFCRLSLFTATQPLDSSALLVTGNGHRLSSAAPTLSHAAGSYCELSSTTCNSLPSCQQVAVEMTLLMTQAALLVGRPSHFSTNLFADVVSSSGGELGGGSLTRAATPGRITLPKPHPRTDNAPEATPQPRSLRQKRQDATGDQIEASIPYMSHMHRIIESAVITICPGIRGLSAHPAATNIDRLAATLSYIDGRPLQH